MSIVSDIKVDKSRPTLLYMLDPGTDVSQWYTIGACKAAVDSLKYLAQYTGLFDRYNVIVSCRYKCDDLDACLLDILDEYLGQKPSYVVYCNSSSRSCVKDYHQSVYDHVSDRTSVEVIHCNSPQYSVVSALNGICEKDPRVKIIYTHHSPTDTSFVGFNYRSDYIKFLNNPNCHLILVGHNNVMRLQETLKLDESEKTLPDIFTYPNVKVLYNSLPLNTENVWRKPQFNRAVVVGRTEPSKSILESIEVAQNLVSEVVFVGDCDPAKKATVHHKERCIEALRPGDRHYTRLSNDRVLDLYKNADIAVCLSTIETFGLSALEAISCGCRVLGINEGGIGEILSHLGLPSVPTESLKRKRSDRKIEILSEFGRDILSSTVDTDRLRRVYRDSFLPEVQASKLYRYYDFVISTIREETTK